MAAVGDGLDATRQPRRHRKIVTPGLIDLHTHVYWGGTSLGIDADEFARTSAVTTCVDTGSAGPGNFPGFRKHVIEPSDARILAYLHISFAGIFAFSKTVMVGESHDLRLMAAREAVEVADANRDVIIGIKVRIGRDRQRPLRHRAARRGAAGRRRDRPAGDGAYRRAAAELRGASLNGSRPGDVLTHCFRPFPNAPVTSNRQVKPEVIAARERGVFFDIGHGMGSFGWKTARVMMDAGFPPDTISSDIHMLCIDGPAFDQVTTLSKFLALGMPLPDVIAASTVNAARAAAARPRQLQARQRRRREHP